VATSDVDEYLSRAVGTLQWSRCDWSGENLPRKKRSKTWNLVIVDQGLVGEKLPGLLVSCCKPRTLQVL